MKRLSGKIHATKLDTPSSIPKTHMVETEPTLASCPMTSTCPLWTLITDVIEKETLILKLIVHLSPITMPPFSRGGDIFRHSEQKLSKEAY